MKRPASVRAHVRIHTVLFVLGLAVMAIGTRFSRPLELHWLVWAGFAVFLAALIYRLLKVRCPHCSSMLLSCHTMPEHCPDCGKKLE